MQETDYNLNLIVVRISSLSSVNTFGIKFAKTYLQEKQSNGREGRVIKTILALAIAVGLSVVLLSRSTAHWVEGTGVGKKGEMAAEWAGSQSWVTPMTPIADFSEEEARERVQSYFDKFFLDYEVVQVLPSVGRNHVMYVVQIFEPSGELRTVHINLWGDVIPVVESPVDHKEDSPAGFHLGN